MIAEHKELQASCLGIDRSGMLAILAGRRCLATVPLLDPNEVSKKVSRPGKWDVSSVEWSPNEPIFALACNQVIPMRFFQSVKL